MANSRCLILGAGFSRTCGLPLARELTPIVWRAMAREDPTDRSANATIRQPGAFGYERLETDLKAIRTLFPNCACDPERAETWPDFEELVTALDESHRYQRSFERLMGTRADDWAGHAKHWLMHHLQERLSELTDAALAAGLGPITQFVKCVNTESDSIISFNWDVLLEIAADELGTPVRYRDDLGPGLRIAKPHGSLNLVDSPKDEYDKARASAINVFGLDEELGYEMNGTKRVVLRAHDPRQAWIRQAWAPRESVVLVEPNIRKAYDRYWLEVQWVRALGMVRNADEIVVIGFSLPPADLRPRILLQLAQLNRNPAPSLTIVDPNATVLCNHYHKLTGFAPRAFVGTLTDYLATGR